MQLNDGDLVTLLLFSFIIHCLLVGYLVHKLTGGKVEDFLARRTSANNSLNNNNSQVSEVS